MQVSVITPAYNAERYIEQAICSLLRDTGPVKLDIIVIDDGSTDGTVDVVSGLAERHPEVRLIAAPHSGISVTRNRGLDAVPTDSPFVTFHDADDVAFPGRIARQVAILESQPDVQVVYGLIQYFETLDDETLLPSLSSRTLTTRTIQLSSAVYRREVLARVGRFDETLAQAEDTDYLFRLVETGANVLMEDEVATFYRRHDTNTTRDFTTARRDFLKAIYKSVQRRRQNGGKVVAPLASGIFTERAQVEEFFASCTAPIAS